MKSLVSRRARGFTLIELTITIAVAIVLLTLGVPSMQGFFDRERLIGASEQLYSHLQQARIESIARSTDVYVNFATVGGTWQYGLKQDAACDLATDPNGCFLLVDEGDQVVDADDEVRMVFDIEEFDGVSATVSFDPGTGAQIAFNSLRGTAAFTPDPGDDKVHIDLESRGGRELRVTVGLLGQLGICSPDDSVDGYKKC